MGRRTGRHATVAMIDTINTVVGTSPKNGLIRDASYVLLAMVSSLLPASLLTAAPKGFAKLARAVAPILHPSVNHISLYRVGAARTNGCANPVKICPTMTTGKMLVLVPAYRIQLPISNNMDAAMIDGLGPRWSR